MRRWLQAELFRVRGFSIKRLHGATLIAVLTVAAILLVALGVFVGTHFPYRTLPAPPVPKGQVKPDCSTSGNHTLGECLPQRPGATPATGGKTASGSQIVRAALTTGVIGPDLSNNDPVYSSAGWDGIKAHSRFVYVKSIEGTGYYDSTAASMAAAAKARGIPVGGYDFQHVCGNSASGEAAFFVRALRAQGLLGKGTLPPAADSEVGSGSCGGRVWLQNWVDTVYNLDGHVCPITYTGAWWWQPNVGSFWPTCQNRQLLTWISGYGVRYPYMPSGVSHLDFWQFSDHAYNGSSVYGDLSAWQHDGPSFAAFAHATPPKPADPYRIFDRTVRHFGNVAASEYGAVRGWDVYRCQNPVRRGVCVTTRQHLVLLRDRLWKIAHARRSGNWTVFHRGARYQGLARRLR